jgi:lambda family phage portal protein
MKFLNAINPLNLLKRRGLTLLKRGFSGAKMGRSLAQWIGSYESPDAILKNDLARLRARSRDLGMNDPYIKYFFRMVSTNVIGPVGFKLQMQSDDKVLNSKIEKLFKKWGKKGICTVCGGYSWVSLKKAVSEAVARDGEIIIRLIKGKDAKNKFNFALQIIEADHLDEKYNTMLSNGNIVRMGIEINSWGRPQAYYIFTNHPHDISFQHRGQERIRIPANEILHIHIKDRPAQSRGVPWTSNIISRMKQLNGFDEAAIINARSAACKMGFFTKPTENEDNYEGDESKDSNFQSMTEFEPGVIDELPAGWDFKGFDAKYPSDQYAPFKKAMLQSIAAGLCVSYNNMAKDLENVNFSSIRQGTLDDREVWRSLQFWFIEELAQPVFNAWLECIYLSNLLDLPSNISLENLEDPIFRPRGWSWIDPLKDVKANRESVDAGFKSSSDVVADQGGDIEDVYLQLEKEQELRKNYNLTTTANDNKTDIIKKSKK